MVNDSGAIVVCHRWSLLLRVFMTFSKAQSHQKQINQSAQLAWLGSFRPLGGHLQADTALCFGRSLSLSISFNVSVHKAGQQEINKSDWFATRLPTHLYENDCKDWWVPSERKLVIVFVARSCSSARFVCRTDFLIDSRSDSNPPILVIIVPIKKRMGDSGTTEPLQMTVYGEWLRQQSRVASHLIFVLRRTKGGTLIVHPKIAFDATLLFRFNGFDESRSITLRFIVAVGIELILCGGYKRRLSPARIV